MPMADYRLSASGSNTVGHGLPKQRFSLLAPIPPYLPRNAFATCSVSLHGFGPHGFGLP